jgi:dihydroorotate dehydrogenase
LPDLSVRLGDVELKNPVLCGSGEPTMTLEGLRAAIDAGAAAVVAKSANESDAARRQLAAAHYVLLDESWRELEWGPAPRSASLFNRSGLAPQPFGQWLEILAEADGYAREHDAYVVASLIVGDVEEAASLAREIEAAGLRWLELNVGAPHAEEATVGAIRAGAELVEPVRAATSLPLTVKLPGQGDVLGLVEAVREAGADHVCLAGRSLAFLPDLATRRPVLGTFGAIGGAWALPLTLRWIAKARARFGPDVPIVGTNGARDGADVARFLLTGATAVELTTAVMTDGFGALTRSLDELSRYLDAQGVTATELIGEAADAVMTYEEVAVRRDG